MNKITDEIRYHSFLLISSHLSILKLVPAAKNFNYLIVIYIVSLIISNHINARCNYYDIYIHTYIYIY